MIGNLTVTISAKDPTKKCETLRAYINSPSNVRIVGVPRALGKWKITRVYFTVNYPDNTSLSKECTEGASVYVVTVSGSTLPGKSTLGYSVKADGTDETGAPVVGYVLGKGDVEIADTDGTVTPGVTTHYIHVLPSCPASPREGDAYVENGTWRIYNGTAWTVLGGVSAGNSYVMAPVANGGDGKWHRMLIVDGTLAYDQEGLDNPPLAADKPWVLTQVDSEAAARNAAISAAVSAEATARQTADSTNAAAISAETTARQTADATNAAAISEEATARQTADSTNAAAISAETTARQTADATNAAAISAEATARQTADATNAAAISAETTARETADATNAAAISAETTARQTADATNAAAISAEANRATAAETEEAAARAAADATKVSLSGNETINGTKTFSASPSVPTVASTSDNSTKAASTGWVTSKLAAWWNTIKAAAITFGSTVTSTGGFVGNLTGNVTGHASQDALDSAVVKLSGNQSIDGVKSFNSDIVSTRTMNGSSVYLRNRFSAMTRGDATTYGKTAALDLEDKDALMLMRFAMSSFTADGRRVANILGYLDDGTSLELASFALYPNGNVRPGGAALASASMPSGTWTTPIASEEIVNGAYYTAEKNGYLVIRGTSTSPTDMINIQDNSTLLANKVYANATNTALVSWLPMLAGKTYTIYINGTITNLISRFVRNEAQN